MATINLEVLFAPAEFAVLSRRDLAQTVCVVFDILRATSSMVTALANGAREILPVGEIDEALAIRRSRPEVLLAGERHGLRIGAEQTGGLDFDLGNSPREFVRKRVDGRTLVMTTTNGTRALRACASAHSIIIGSFLGLRAIANWIERENPENLLFVCSGTLEQAAYEDALAAGALCDLIWRSYSDGSVSDSSQMALHIYRQCQNDLVEAVGRSRNGRRLLSQPELRDDVPACLARDTINFLAELGKDGAVRVIAK